MAHRPPAPPALLRRVSRGTPVHGSMVRGLPRAAAAFVLFVATALPGCTSDDTGGAAETGHDLGGDLFGPDVSSPDGGLVEGADGLCRTRLAEDEVCSEDAACAEPLRCIEGRCRVRSLEGEPCDARFDCVNELYCERYDLDGRQLPQPVCRSRVALSERCHDRNSSMCQVGSCIRGECAFDSLAGGPCESNADCEGSTLYCDLAATAPDGLAGACSPRLGAGALCARANSGCATGLTCLDGECVPNRLDGETCSSQSDCASGLYCARYDGDGSLRAQRICLPRHALGAPCVVAESFNCVQGRCLGGVCVDDQPEGAACAANGDCASGLRCDD
jgi:hypothetical protein